MRRDLEALTRHEYDVLVVGGGISGLCAAWDATQRGLRVALLEQEDFAHGASANCFKMVHGGIRYLQHADVYRIRESSCERSVFMRIAPHLVRPLPIVIPTYGHGLTGRELLGAGALVYDILTFDRNWGVEDTRRHIPRARSISARECLRLFPCLPAERLTGGLEFFDGQMYSPARLAITFGKSAAALGAELANYVEVLRFVVRDGRAQGVAARDVLTGDRFEVRARIVLNATGGWAPRVLESAARLDRPRALTFSRDAAFVVNRQLTGERGLALLGSARDADAFFSRGRRHLFIAPWRGRSIVGVWHRVQTDPPDAIDITEAELRRFIAEVNAAYPALDLALSDVALCLSGLTLLSDRQPGAHDVHFGKRSLVVDHARDDSIEQLISVIGVRFTTARSVAERAVDLIVRKLGRAAPRSRTAVTPVYGSYSAEYSDLDRVARTECPVGVDRGVFMGLLRNHGSAYRDVLRYFDVAGAGALGTGVSKALRAEIVHAVRDEMALTLSDVVMRRTDLGSAGHPGEAALAECASMMAAELGWTGRRMEDELEAVQAHFPRFGFGAAVDTLQTGSVMGARA